VARILIVEDEGLIAMYAESVLAEAGYEVVGIAYTVDEALQMAREHQPDLVLLDIHLRGGENGVEVARTLRGKTRIAFCTAEHKPEGIPGVAETKAVGFLKKPYDKADLTAVVAKLLEASAAEWA
jgi:CheY-like chemotaxis protein